MPSTIDNILDNFPFATIAPIIGPPNFKTISELHMNLNSNVVSIQYNLGDGALKLLYLTVSPTVYTTLLATAFIVPMKSGSYPIIPDSITGPAIADLRYAFQLDKEIFTEYDRTDKGLYQILLASISKLYFWSF